MIFLKAIFPSMDCDWSFQLIPKKTVNITSTMSFFQISPFRKDAAFILLNSIILQCSISILLENVRKPLLFWRFQGV